MHELGNTMPLYLKVQRQFFQLKFLFKKKKPEFPYENISHLTTKESQTAGNGIERRKNVRTKKMTSFNRGGGGEGTQNVKFGSNECECTCSVYTPPPNH